MPTSLAIVSAVSADVPWNNRRSFKPAGESKSACVNHTEPYNSSANTFTTVIAITQAPPVNTLRRGHIE